jgi:hypothetical protein
VKDPVVPAHYLTISLLCAYQKWSGRSITGFEEGQKIVSDLWNALHQCTSKKNAVLFLKNQCDWDCANHQMLAFMSELWMYQPSIKHHEAHACLSIAVSKF